MRFFPFMLVFIATIQRTTDQEASVFILNPFKFIVDAGLYFAAMCFKDLVRRIIDGLCLTEVDKMKLTNSL